MPVHRSRKAVTGQPLDSKTPVSDTHPHAQTDDRSAPTATTASTASTAGTESRGRNGVRGHGPWTPQQPGGVAATSGGAVAAPPGADG